MLPHVPGDVSSGAFGDPDPDCTVECMIYGTTLIKLVRFNIYASAMEGPKIPKPAGRSRFTQHGAHLSGIC